MDEDRYRELAARRDGPGLSDEEANELGRMEAERMGKPYGNAQSPPPEVVEERQDIGLEDVALEHARVKEHEDVDLTPPSPERDAEGEKDLPPPY